MSAWVIARVVARLAMLGCALAACGDNRAGLGGAGPCTATFTGAFSETSGQVPSCVVVDPADTGTALRFSITSRTIQAPFEIAFDLGPAAGAGSYTSDSLVTPWSADALHELDMTSCLYHAGTAAVPPGQFTLELTELTELTELDDAELRAHGSLDLMVYVLARPYTYCGETNTERLSVSF